MEHLIQRETLSYTIADKDDIPRIDGQGLQHTLAGLIPHVKVGQLCGVYRPPAMGVINAFADGEDYAGNNDGQ